MFDWKTYHNSIKVPKKQKNWAVHCILPKKQNNNKNIKNKRYCENHNLEKCSLTSKPILTIWLFHFLSKISAVFYKVFKKDIENEKKLSSLLTSDYH